LVEDHDDLAATIADHLETGGFQIDHAYDLASARSRLKQRTFDAVIVDRGLPDGDGIELCALIRADPVSPATPILVLTARDVVADRLAGFAAGADDYLVKPFSLDELAARLRAIHRRNHNAKATRVQIGDLAVDFATSEVTRAGQLLRLPPICRRLLETLVRHAPHTVTRAQLERVVWGDDPPDSDALKSHIHQLRAIIDRPFSTPLLHHVPGVGYRLVDPATP
jgi:DNA-binding response OmpR family regulator